MTIWEHLSELRSRLMRVFLAIAAAAVIGWIAFPTCLSFLQRPYCDIQPNCDLLALDPLEPFMVRLKVSAYIGDRDRDAGDPVPDLALRHARLVSPREALRVAVHPEFDVSCSSSAPASRTSR